MFKGFCSIIMTLSLLGIAAAPLDAGISKTTTFTLSVTIPERSELPASASLSQPISKLSTPQNRPFHLQRDIRDNQDVYLVSFVTD